MSAVPAVTMFVLQVFGHKPKYLKGNPSYICHRTTNMNFMVVLEEKLTKISRILYLGTTNVCVKICQSKSSLLRYLLRACCVLNLICELLRRKGHPLTNIDVWKVCEVF